MTTHYYFGYGALKNRRIVKEIIGRDPGVGRSAILRGFQLGYQSLKQIPSAVSEQLKQIWGDAFKAYTLVKGNGVVSGVVWELTEDEFIRIQQWNFVGKWRALSTGRVILDDNTEVTVDLDMITSNQRIEGIVVDGIEGIPNLFTEVVEGKRNIEDYKREQENELINARELLKKISQPLSDSPHMYS